MNREVSAGGIIVTKSNGRWFVLVMKDMNNNWTFPKGKTEKGESLEETALREIQEEVGVTSLSKIADLTPSHYWYFRNGSIKKTVHYFLFQSAKKQKTIVQTEEGISEAKWVSFPLAQKLLGYPDTNSALIKEARANLPK